MPHHLESKCPACLSQSMLLGEVTSDAATRHFKDEVSTPDDFRKLKNLIEELWNGNRCSRRKCLNCSLIFSDPFSAGDSRFYNLAHSSHVYPRNRWEYKVALDNIPTLGDDSFTLLEIGAGRGEFLRDVIRQGVPPEKLFAIEFDEVGLNVITSLGIHCANHDVRKAEILIGKRFKVITFFQVFEHLDDLDSFILTLYKMTEADGIVILSVPNNLRTEFMEKAIDFIDMPPNHLSTWNREALKFVFERNNFKMKYFETQRATRFNFYYQLIYYSILMRRQNGARFEKKLLGLRMRKLRIIFFASFAIWHVVAKIPKFFEFDKNLGESQLAIFQKAKES